MIVKRGDVVLTRVPHASGGRGKKRPAVVVQSDIYCLVHEPTFARDAPKRG